MGFKMPSMRTAHCDVSTLCGANPRMSQVRGSARSRHPALMRRAVVTASYIDHLLVINRLCR